MLSCHRDWVAQLQACKHFASQRPMLHLNEQCVVPWFRFSALCARRPGTSISQPRRRTDNASLTSDSWIAPPSRIFIKHSSSLCVPNSLSKVELLGLSYAFWAPCLNQTTSQSRQTQLRMAKSYLWVTKILNPLTTCAKGIDLSSLQFFTA